jgi:hypothetical protein
VLLFEDRETHTGFPVNGGQAGRDCRRNGRFGSPETSCRPEPSSRTGDTSPENHPELPERRQPCLGRRQSLRRIGADASAGYFGCNTVQIGPYTWYAKRGTVRKTGYPFKPVERVSDVPDRCHDSTSQSPSSVRLTSCLSRGGRPSGKYGTSPARCDSPLDPGTTSGIGRPPVSDDLQYSGGSRPTFDRLVGRSPCAARSARHSRVGEQTSRWDPKGLIGERVRRSARVPA